MALFPVFLNGSILFRHKWDRVLFVIGKWAWCGEISLTATRLPISCEALEAPHHILPSSSICDKIDDVRRLRAFFNFLVRKTLHQFGKFYRWWLNVHNYFFCVILNMF